MNNSLKNLFLVDDLKKYDQGITVGELVTQITKEIMDASIILEAKKTEKKVSKATTAVVESAIKIAKTASKEARRASKLAVKEALKAEKLATKEALKAEKKATKLAVKEALNAEKKAAKEAFKAEKKATKLAARESLKAEKLATKEALKAAKKATKEALKAEKLSTKLATKEALKAEKLATKLAAKEALKAEKKATKRRAKKAVHRWMKDGNRTKISAAIKGLAKVTGKYPTATFHLLLAENMDVEAATKKFKTYGDAGWKSFCGENDFAVEKHGVNELGDFEGTLTHGMILGMTSKMCHILWKQLPDSDKQSYVDAETWGVSEIVSMISDEIGEIKLATRHRCPLEPLSCPTQTGNKVPEMSKKARVVKSRLAKAVDPGALWEAVYDENKQELYTATN